LKSWKEGRVKKSEVGSPKSESPEEELKAERPKQKVRNKPEVESPKSEEEDNSAFDLPHTEITEPLTTMEVHHHPEVEKKGIKEYILEGLMIFLAVMMGFFAESLREHINEQHQAADYAVNLYNDLKADSAELHEYHLYFKFANENVDTLMQLLSDNDPRRVPSGELYYFGLFGGAYHVFTPHDATMLTMKSSGALRFFGDKAISRKLAVYDELCQNFKQSEEKENGIYVETRRARAQIFEYKYNEVANDLYHGVLKIRDGNANGALHGYTWSSIDSFKKTNPPLLSYDKTLFNEYVEMVRSRFLATKVARGDTLLHRATELIRLLRKKYDVESE
jgi:hypothetical protein